MKGLIKFYDLASKYSKIEFIEDDINFLKVINHNLF
ncbi:MAG: hypothetical protein CM15mP102_05100 [Flavobacteriales bacterium]|nr:MAG: hypothetical protein CM15mP102_05100 [Flavobacteriales bacterium]